MNLAGKYDQRVTIKRPVRTADNFGEPVDGTPTTVATRWAWIKPLTGREMDFADRLAAETTHMVELRTPFSVQKTDYIVWGSRTLQIEADLTPPRSGKTVLACKETV
jgi:head-tail adaptor